MKENSHCIRNQILLREENLIMKPTTKILDRIRKNTERNNEEVFTRLYRYMLRPDMYYRAYQNLYANKGAATRGVDDDTADGFSEEKINGIISAITDGSYTPKPVRREYIQKKTQQQEKTSAWYSNLYG